MKCICKRCNHAWFARVDAPQCCPNCKSRKWNVAAALAILALLSLVIPAFAEEPGTDWTTQDTVFQVAYSALHIIDWGQSRYIANSPDSCRAGKDRTVVCVPSRQETNPILGEYPSQDKVDLYFGLTLPAHAAISYGLRKSGWKLFDTPLVTLWQSVWIGIEGYQVGDNYSAGIKMDF